MWPGSARGLDLVVVPAHDKQAERAGVLRIAGTPHRITRGAAGRGCDSPCAPSGGPAAAIHHLSGRRQQPPHAVHPQRRARARAPGQRGGARAGRQPPGHHQPAHWRGLRRGAGVRDRAAAAAAPVCTRGRQSLSRHAGRGGCRHRDGGIRLRCASRPAAAASPCCCSGRPPAPRRSSPAYIAGWSRRAICARSAAPWPQRCPPPLNPAASVAEAIRRRILGPIGAAPGRMVVSG